MKIAKKLMMALILLSAVFCFGYAQSTNQPSTNRDRFLLLSKLEQNSMVNIVSMFDIHH
ncbi:MAG: hypothetical protein HDR88_17400 [Bacteroides sp.]|nr:hypothetical protein [Bacteroides sp.]MBD5358736.1 hypothetical protein [Bacteroides sp.]